MALIDLSAQVLAATLTPLPTTATQDEINLLAGPRLIGLLFNWGLLGVLSAQVYVYYLNFPEDRWGVKALVATVYILDWIQTGSATSDAFNWFVYGYGSIPRLFGLYQGWLNIPILSSTIAAIVQCYFAWRIMRFTNTKVIPAMVILLALIQLCGGIGVAYFIFNDPNEVSREPGLVEAVAVRLGTSGLVDIVIAIAMTYYLLKSRTVVSPHLNNVMTKIIRLTVETGTLTACMAIVDLVFFITQHNGMHQVSGVLLCKIYSNTLLVSFNHRMYMQTPTTHIYTGDSTNSRGLSFAGRQPTTVRSEYVDLEAMRHEPDSSKSLPQYPTTSFPTPIPVS